MLLSRLALFPHVQSRRSFRAPAQENSRLVVGTAARFPEALTIWPLRMRGLHSAQRRAEAGEVPASHIY